MSTRRTFLSLLGTAPLLALLPFASATAQDAACYSPDALPLSQKSRRRSLGYLDQSTDPKRTCGQCSFFKESQPGCGTCVMLSGAPVNRGAICNSFAPKST